MTNKTPENFLIDYVDSEEAREALFSAGIILIDEAGDSLYRYLVEGDDSDLGFKGYLPPAFRGCLDHGLALKMYAAAVALMTNLCDNRPAGCVAEEIMAVSLISTAECWMELNGSGDPPELHGIFDLFEDSDVLFLFDMKEPADANVARESDVNVQLGVVDQTVDAWFDAFGHTFPTGLYNEEE